MSKSAEAALAAATKMIAGSVEGEPEAPSGDVPVVEDETIVPEETGEFTLPELEVELPEELLLELGLDEEPELEVEDEVDDDDDLYGDDAKLKRELAKAKKEAAYYKNLRVKASRKTWEDEAKRFFPLSESVLHEIQADSRRSFLRQAQSAHETIKPFVMAERARVTAALEVEKEKAREEARAEAAAAWGKPTVGNEGVPDLEEREAKLQVARENRDLTGAIRAMMFPAKKG